MAAGGQGAPLVPIADAILFASPSHWRALQNIGGIGNVSVVPPGGARKDVLAFDTGPGVVVIDGVVERLTMGADRMDRDARYSSGGRPIASVVAETLQEPFFSKKPPRSTGREFFSHEFIDDFIGRCRAANESVTDADVVATAVQLTVRSIVHAYRSFVAGDVGEVLLSGGGARHPLLRSQLAQELAPMKVRDFSEAYFDAEAKEAVAFALLGYLHLKSRAGNIPSATGALGERILGKLTPA
jgi:anhydro-N-acetylmuramic acid kinase